MSWAARLYLSDCYYSRRMHVTVCCHENADIKNIHNCNFAVLYRRITWSFTMIEEHELREPRKIFGPKRGEGAAG